MSTEEIQDHIVCHRPKAAYLGSIEMAAMKAEFEKHCIYPCNPEPYKTHTIEYATCPIFEVRVESHVGFAQ